MDDEKAVAEEMRRKATERLSAKKKRKVEEAYSDKDEAGPSRRKSQRSLVEIMEHSVTTRREEKKREMEIKENELKQQEQFHGTLLQQQQQMQQMHLQQQQQQQAMDMVMMSTLSENAKHCTKFGLPVATELHNSCQFTSVFPHVYLSVHV